MNFNKKIFLSNLKLFLDKTNTKPAELETMAAVSRGYISRLKLDGNKSVPGIDFLMTAAELFGVSVEALCTVDFASITETDEYYLKLLEKLIDSTEKRNVIWKKLTITEFKKKIISKNSSDNEVFTKKPCATEIINNVENAIWDYNSDFDYGKFRFVGTGDYFYEMKMDDKNSMYIVRSIMSYTEDDNYSEVYGVELFIVRDRKEKINLCCYDPEERHGLNSMISKLYSTVIDFTATKTMDSKTRKLLDDFISEN